MRSKSLLLNPTRAGARRRGGTNNKEKDDYVDYNAYTHDPDAPPSSNGGYDSAPEHTSHPSNGAPAAAPPGHQLKGYSSTGSHPVWTPAVPVHQQRKRRRAAANRIMAVIWLGLAYSFVAELGGMFSTTSSVKKDKYGSLYGGDGGLYDSNYGSKYDKYGSKYRSRGAADRYGDASAKYGGGSKYGGGDKYGTGYGSGGKSSSLGTGGGGGGGVIDRRTSRDGSVQVVTKAQQSGTGSYGTYGNSGGAYGNTGGAYGNAGSGAGAGGGSSYGAAGTYGSKGTGTYSNTGGYGGGAGRGAGSSAGNTNSAYGTGNTGYGGGASNTGYGASGNAGYGASSNAGYGAGAGAGAKSYPRYGAGSIAEKDMKNGASAGFGGFGTGNTDGKTGNYGAGNSGYGAGSGSYGKSNAGYGVGGNSNYGTRNTGFGTGGNNAGGFGAASNSGYGAQSNNANSLWSNPQSSSLLQSGAGVGANGDSTKVKSLEEKLSKLESKLDSLNDKGGGDKKKGGGDGEMDLFKNALKSAGGKKVTITFGDDGSGQAAAGGAGAAALAAGAAADDSTPQLSGLSCPAPFGKAPIDESVLNDLVYWDDVPSDASFLSPFHTSSSEIKYLTFEPDVGGWNNARTVLETMVVLAHSTGRTLVLPPRFVLPHSTAGTVGTSAGFGGAGTGAGASAGVRRRLAEYDDGLGGGGGGGGVAMGSSGYGGSSYGRTSSRKDTRSYQDFFHLDRLSREYAGINIVTMDEFLRRESRSLAKPPPDGRTDWDDAALTLRHAHELPLWTYLREVGIAPEWNPVECVAAFPARGNAGIPELRDMMEGILRKKDGRGLPDSLDFQGKPTPVNYPPVERLREIMAGRTRLCAYEPELQSSKLLHFTNTGHQRMLVQWYSFAFFEDWRHDLWTKRLVRDHLRYRDEIFCAAGRVVEALRRRAWYKNQAGNPEGHYDGLHVRRGDFGAQYPDAISSAESILQMTRELGGSKKKRKKMAKGSLPEGSFAPNATVYVATDERDRSYFDPLAEEYDVVYLTDFLDALGPDVDPAHHGMIEQIVLARSRTFAGTYYSTYSSYVHRLRGYYASRDIRSAQMGGDALAPGRGSNDDGSLKGSYYHGPKQARGEMRTYRAVRRPFWQREFPVAWRDVDKGVGELRWEGW